MQLPDPFDFMGAMWEAMMGGTVITSLGLRPNGRITAYLEDPATACGDHVWRLVGDTGHVLCTRCAVLEHVEPAGPFIEADLRRLTIAEADELSHWAVGQLLLRGEDRQCDALVAETVEVMRNKSGRN